MRDVTGAEPPVASQRRALALLALLAASGEAGISRDKLLAYLWPESDDDHARNSLRQLLHSLRKGLSRDDLFLGTTDLRLNPSAIDADVHEFERALRRGEQERAAELYQGQFLDGVHLTGTVEFDEWAAELRVRLAARAADALEQLARRAASAGDAVGAVTWWRRSAALSPLDSRIAMELMRALAAAGNPTGALQHARVHDELVRQVLGGAPDPAVAKLAEQLRSSGSRDRSTSSTTAPSHASTPEAASRSGKLRERLQAALADRYDIERELGRREGTTLAFLGRDRRHERAVVIKVLHPAVASAIDTQRFLREIQLTARLNHPHIVPVLDSSQVGDQPWFAMPHLAGESLRDHLTRSGRPDRARTLEMVADIADALAYAHRHGIVHRDLRPENIFLAEGQALVTNFGLARAAELAAESRVTASGIVLGSPAYMSPEQAEGAPADLPSDIYSLGTVLYELLAGELPFTGPTPQAVMAKRAAVAEGWETRPEFGPRLNQLMRSVLAISPERRPSATRFAEVLRTPDGVPEPSRLGPGRSLVGSIMAWIGRPKK